MVILSCVVATKTVPFVSVIRFFIFIHILRFNVFFIYLCVSEKNVVNQ